MLRPAHGARGVHRDDLAHHKPVEQHPDTGELELDGRSRHPALQLLNVSRDVDGLHVAQMTDAFSLAPGGEFPGRLAVGLPDMGVADVGGEEFEDAALGLWVGAVERGERVAGRAGIGLWNSG